MSRFSNVTALINSADFTPTQAKVLRELFDAVVDDRAAVYTGLAALDTALDTLATKLNADAANTALDDIDYVGALSAMPTATALTGLPG